jgi:hypothetical protein
MRIEALTSGRQRDARSNQHNRPKVRATRGSDIRDPLDARARANVLGTRCFRIRGRVSRSRNTAFGHSTNETPKSIAFTQHFLLRIRL